MSYNSSCEISKAIKTLLEKNKLISDSFKLQVAGIAKHHVDKKAFNINAAEMLWNLVHKYTPDSSNFSIPNKRKHTKKLPSLKKVENADDAINFDEKSLSFFRNKIKLLSTDNASRRNLLSELWDFRKLLLKSLIIDGHNVKLTLSLLDRVLAKELDIDDKNISIWHHHMNQVFFKNCLNDNNISLRKIQIKALNRKDPFTVLMKYRLDELGRAYKPAENDSENIDEEDPFSGIEDLSFDPEERILIERANETQNDKLNLK
ncbi:hypothetical protein FOG18_06330 [Legionella israelensis]|uniref:hypothetical protein n=1 Tax=Legionella israelensis TaxID=454 RepID=UPI001180C295|nr:hypothetical protein [Legionella israelensis]QDP72204.1 hypothetical protein FOG18_06330 [Legionella israelensis]